MKLLIADELPLFKDSLVRLAKSVIPNSQITSVSDLSSLRQKLAAESDIKIVFMDLHLPGSFGLSEVAQIQNEFPNTQLVVISSTESPMIVYRTVKLGARGFIPKSASPSMFKQAISAIHTGKVWIPEELKTVSGKEVLASNLESLSCEKSECISEKIASLSPRQFKVLTMISDGKLNKQIAYCLELQEGTVKHHVSLILQKLKVINRTEAANMFNRLKVQETVNMRALKRA